jgi:S-adenosylmethionine synthetase
MIYKSKMHTVESVTSGHPDKICDQISDAILDACLAKDPNSRVAVESFGGHGFLVIGGEVTTKAKVNFKKIAEKVYREIGYRDKLKVKVNVVCQSPDIAQGVDTGGAGDQGIMYGYATNETREFLPKGVVLVHKIAEGLERLRTEEKIPWLRPDGKSQVTFNGNKLKTILVSCQHSEKVTQKEIKKTLINKLIRPLVGNTEGIEILVNPTGKFIQGGFFADTGLTGRKIMVDTYCGLVPHGGGCFSGKDPSKVDRSAAYMARFAAKNIVARGLAKKCLVSVSYAIGKAEPLMVSATDEKGRDISKLVRKKFDFRPRAIIQKLNLLRPIYQKTAAYGHFGKPDFPWEQIING